MAEYIEREAVLAMKKPFPTSKDSITLHQQYFISPSAVEKIPAADVRPVVKAEWHGEGDGYADGKLVYDMWACPVCGKRFFEWEEKPDWNFCPNCGADMREKS